MWKQENVFGICARRVILNDFEWMPFLHLVYSLVVVTVFDILYKKCYHQI